MFGGIALIGMTWFRKLLDWISTMETFDNHVAALRPISEAMERAVAGIPIWVPAFIFAAGFGLLAWDMAGAARVRRKLVSQVTVSSTNVATSPEIPPPDLSEQQAKKRRAVYFPRLETVFAKPVGVDELIALAAHVHVLIRQGMAGSTQEHRGWIAEIMEIVQSEIDRGDRGGAPDEVPDGLRQRLERLIVLLKGSDISIYAYDHWKRLPERTVEPSTPDPFELERQLHVAFWPTGASEADHVEIQVDNGQPRTLPPL